MVNVKIGKKKIGKKKIGTMDMNKICINCKHCEILSPSVGYCEIRGCKMEMKCSYCDKYFEEREEEYEI
jgi:hypothetical protein